MKRQFILLACLVSLLVIGGYTAIAALTSVQSNQAAPTLTANPQTGVVADPAATTDQAGGAVAATGQASQPGAKQRGVAWTAGREPLQRSDLTSLVDSHVDWITQTPFGWQDRYDSPNLQLKTTGTWWGETDVGLTVTTQYVQELGIKTLLKPHIWLRQTPNGTWRTDIAMQSEADWQTWFANYRTFILHYARFAEEHQIAALCVGTELEKTAVQREQDWRDLIAEIRQVFHGQLTYAANWYQAFEEIQFWDALDFIGIQAYFPLTDQNSPTVEQLKQGWQPYLESIARVQQRFQKPVIFTEIGYRSDADAAIKPWEWPNSSEQRPSVFATAAGLETQANCYQAFFEAVWGQAWLAG
ncbi:MAG: glycoside hydrolase TIM-barrel-like domain-containing protein, partial [Cyanobacteria bacterium P01_H01_bin.121]